MGSTEGNLLGSQGTLGREKHGFLIPMRMGNGASPSTPRLCAVSQPETSEFLKVGNANLQAGGYSIAMHDYQSPNQKYDPMSKRIFKYTGNQTWDAHLDI